MNQFEYTFYSEEKVVCEERRQLIQCLVAFICITSISFTTKRKRICILCFRNILRNTLKSAHAKFQSF